MPSDKVPSGEPKIPELMAETNSGRIDQKLDSITTYVDLLLSGELGTINDRMRSALRGILADIKDINKLK